jgi:hypothetical protein
MINSPNLNNKIKVFHEFDKKKIMNNYFSNELQSNDVELENHSEIV